MRIKYVDIAKGLAILLVIVGHTIDIRLVKGLIFSFHMPLFFVLSAYTMKYSDTFENWKNKNIKFVLRTLATAYLCFILCRLGTFIQGSNYDWGFFKAYLKDTFTAIIFSSGWPGTFLGIPFVAIYALWFLVVFALSKSLFDLINLTVDSKIIMWGGVYHKLHSGRLCYKNCFYAVIF